MRRAASSRATKRPVISSKSLPAPVRGLNARDALASMKEADAVVLDNWFPATSDCQLRRGFSSWATGMTGAIETLMEYASPSTRELKAIVGGDIFDVTASGAVSTAEVTSLSNSRFEHANFGTSGGHFLVIANGQDSVMHYDGSSWSTPTINNVTSSTLDHVNSHKNRLWFIEQNSLSAWYLPTSSVAGDASEFPLYSLARKGGKLQAMATWTVDGGEGIDDLAVWITTNGEVIVYSGTDPASANTWALKGIFEIGKPIGKRCFVKFGGDLIVITEDGFYPLSQALQSSRGRPSAAISDRIVNAVSQASRDYSGNFGWQAILYPKSQWLLFNIPVATSTTAIQYVMNTQTRAWCSFSGMNANCWSILDDDIFFGGSGVVYQADTGTSDDGAIIQGLMLPAFNYLGSRTSQKRATMMRPIFLAGSTVNPMINLNVDFAQDPPMDTLLSEAAGGTPWGSAWGSPWGNESELTIRKDWQSLTADIGFCVSPYISVATTTQSIQFVAYDLLYESGGYL